MIRQWEDDPSGAAAEVFRDDDDVNVTDVSNLLVDDDSMKDLLRMQHQQQHRTPCLLSLWSRKKRPPHRPTRWSRRTILGRSRKTQQQQQQPHHSERPRKGQVSRVYAAFSDPEEEMEYVVDGNLRDYTEEDWMNEAKKSPSSSSFLTTKAAATAETPETIQEEEDDEEDRSPPHYRHTPLTTRFRDLAESATLEAPPPAAGEHHSPIVGSYINSFATPPRQPIADLSFSSIPPSTPQKGPLSPIAIDNNAVLLEPSSSAAAAAQLDFTALQRFWSAVLGGEPPRIPPAANTITATSGTPTNIACQQSGRSSANGDKSHPFGTTDKTRAIGQDDIINFARIEPLTTEQQQQQQHYSTSALIHLDTWLMTPPTPTARGGMDEISSLGSDTPTKILLAANQIRCEDVSPRTLATLGDYNNNNIDDEQVNRRTGGGVCGCACMPNWIKRSPPIFRYALLIGAVLWIAAAGTLGLALLCQNNISSSNNNNGSSVSSSNRDTSWTDNWTYPPSSSAPAIMMSPSPSQSQTPTLRPSQSSPFYESSSPTISSPSATATITSTAPSPVSGSTSTPTSSSLSLDSSTKPTTTTSSSSRPPGLSPTTMAPSLVTTLRPATTAMPVRVTSFPTFAPKGMMGMEKDDRRNLQK